MFPEAGVNWFATPMVLPTAVTRVDCAGCNGAGVGVGPGAVVGEVLGWFGMVLGPDEPPPPPPHPERSAIDAPIASAVKDANGFITQLW